MFDSIEFVGYALYRYLNVSPIGGKEVSNL